jgi:hypothetical protein
MNPIRIVFLDFDGVLNSTQFWQTRGYLSDEFGWGTPEHEDHQLDKAAIQRLNKITEPSDVMVVVSSVWRLRRSRPDLRMILMRNGFTGRLLCKTPVLNKPRGLEIREWLMATARKVSSFVILDDDDDFAEFGRDRLVKTSFHDGGLLDKHVELAENTLARPWKGLT